MKTYYLTNDNKTARYWYDYSCRVWVIQLMSSATIYADQIGDAEYWPTREEAKIIAEQMTRWEAK